MAKTKMKLARKQVNGNGHGGSGTVPQGFAVREAGMTAVVPQVNHGEQSTFRTMQLT